MCIGIGKRDVMKTSMEKGNPSIVTKVSDIPSRDKEGGQRESCVGVKTMNASRDCYGSEMGNGGLLA